MSKIVLFEGLDNCFKTTNVKGLFNFWTKQNKTSHVLHYSGVKTLSNTSGKMLSNKLYTEMFEVFEYFHSKDINVICDRSHLGENVYSRYRNYSPSYIWELEEEFMHKKFWNDLYVIFLKDSNIDNVIKRDDGLSISVKRDDKIFERSKFEEAIYLTNIPNKLTIDVNSKTPEKILNEILNFLNESDIEAVAKEFVDEMIKAYSTYEPTETIYNLQVEKLINLLRG